MEHKNELRDIRERITELLPNNNEYAILNLIYHILLQANSTPPMPESDHATS